ncbi:PBSX family phage terminase large subunit [Capnocytophaga canis]|uniref:PBSX family phage terminase large subunit n=1 Tax=Capnocytophaga canis TaxID=1848903 RepID=UPI002100487A|nr:terminase large subunit [Capnocytophaga canis]
MGGRKGKTFGIIPILIDRAIKEPNKEISIVSESIPHLRRGALKDFIKIMKLTGRWREKSYNKSLLTYTFQNGSYIEFFSADQEDKLRGARRNVLYVNEANNVKWEAFNQLQIRTSEDIWIDFNPSSEFWANEHLTNDEDVDWIILTYKDNEALPQTIIAEIEKAKEKAKTSKYWENWWKVYGLGQLGMLEGVILSDWQTIDKIPDEAELLGCGMDFGYTNDPTTLIEAYKWNGKIIFNELIYEKGLTNTDISKRMQTLGVSKKLPIYADSSEPKSIDEIKSFGFSIKPADKGKDSVNFGLSVLQENSFYITKHSTNTIKELRNYCWDTDRTGKQLNTPIDEYNHSIDAMRYFAIMKLKNKQPQRYCSLKIG